MNFHSNKSLSPDVINRFMNTVNSIMIIMGFKERNMILIGMRERSTVNIPEARSNAKAKMFLQRKATTI
jgi:hypothetical protein